MSKPSITIPLGLVGIALVVAACGSPSATSVSAPQPAKVPSTTKVATTTKASPELGTASTSLGTVLVDARGRTVYEFAADSKNASACSGSCLTYWPPVPAAAAAPTSIPGITGTVGSLTRADGTTQATINGLPLYSYVGDTTAGMTAGQGSNGSGAKWWVVAPDGSPITTSTAGASAPAAPAASSAPAAPSTPSAPSGYTSRGY